MERASGWVESQEAARTGGAASGTCIPSQWGLCWGPSSTLPSHHAQSLRCSAHTRTRLRPASREGPSGGRAFAQTLALDPAL